MKKLKTLKNHQNTKKKILKKVFLKIKKIKINKSFLN